MTTDTRYRTLDYETKREMRDALPRLVVERLASLNDADMEVLGELTDLALVADLFLRIEGGVKVSGEAIAAARRVIRAERDRCRQCAGAERVDSDYIAGNLLADRLDLLARMFPGPSKEAA